MVLDGVVIVVQSLRLLQLIVTLWTAACRTPLSPTVSWSLLKLKSVESVCHPTILFSVAPSPFAFNQGIFQWVDLASGGQSIGASTSASVLPLNIQHRFSLGSTGLISLQSKRLSNEEYPVNNPTRKFCTQIAQQSNCHLQVMGASLLYLVKLCVCPSVKEGGTFQMSLKVIPFLWWLSSKQRTIKKC